MDELRVLVVGGGARGSALAHAWAATDGARVTAVVDPDTDSARALAAEVGAETVAGDYREAIPASDADVVVAATPTFLHRPIAELAAGEGRHVLSEKPIALTLDDADAILAAVARAGVTYGVCHQLRHGDVFAKVAELVRGPLGRPLQVRSNYLLPVRPKVLMHDRHANGGPIIDFLCHRFDYWRHALDAEPRRLSASGFTLADDKPETATVRDFAIDTASCVVEFESGDIWGCNISWGLPPGVQRPGFEDVLGRHGVLTFDQRQVTLQRRGGETEVYDGLDAPLDQRVCEDFAAAVWEGREPKVTGAAAREALRGCLELLASIERGETITR